MIIWSIHSKNGIITANFAHVGECTIARIDIVNQSQYEASFYPTHDHLLKAQMFDHLFKARTWVALQWSRFVIREAKTARMQRKIMIRDYRDMHNLPWADIAARVGMTVSATHKIYWVSKGMYGKVLQSRALDTL